MKPAIALGALLSITLAQQPASQQAQTPPTPAGAKQARSQGQQEDPLIATIGSKEIRLMDLISEINRLIPLTYYHRQIPDAQMQKFRTRAFDSLVVRTLKHLDALDRKLAVSESDVRKEFKKTLTKAGPPWSKANDRQFEKLLEQYRPLVVRRLLIDKNEARFEASLPTIAEKMMRKLYDSKLEEDRSSFQAPRESHLLHIFLKVDPGKIAIEGKEKRKKIDEARKLIIGGKPFSEVALFYSEGEHRKQSGDLGYVVQGKFRSKDLNKIAFQLDKGQLSEVITTLHGYHLIHCVDVKPTRVLTFSEVKSQLEGWLKEEHEQMARGRWMASVRKGHAVKVLRPELITPPKSPGVSEDKATSRKSASTKPANRDAPLPATRPATSPTKQTSSRPQDR